jgi:hypothetical protein
MTPGRKETNMAHSRLRKRITAQVAEAMAIYAGVIDDDHYAAQAEQLMNSFKATEGRWPRDYLEIETWSAAKLDKSGRLLVVK